MNEAVKSVLSVGESQINYCSANTSPKSKHNLMYNPPPHILAKMSKHELSEWRSAQRKVRRNKAARECRMSKSGPTKGPAALIKYKPPPVYNPSPELMVSTLHLIRLMTANVQSNISN